MICAEEIKDEVGIKLNRCPECKRRMIVAHPESEKVCRNCAIVQALTGKNRGDWNST